MSLPQLEHTVYLFFDQFEPRHSIAIPSHSTPLSVPGLGSLSCYLLRLACVCAVVLFGLNYYLGPPCLV